MLLLSNIAASDTFKEKNRGLYRNPRFCRSCGSVVMSGMSKVKHVRDSVLSFRRHEYRIENCRHCRKHDH